MTTDRTDGQRRFDRFLRLRRPGGWEQSLLGVIRGQQGHFPEEEEECRPEAAKLHRQFGIITITHGLRDETHRTAGHQVREVIPEGDLHVSSDEDMPRHSIASALTRLDNDRPWPLALGPCPDAPILAFP